MGIFNWVKNLGTNTLYYPGCLLKGVLKQEFENYKTIFNKLGIDYIMLPDKELCCGLPVLNGGYKKDARKLAKKNLELFKKNKVDKIITSCPSCYHTFRYIYPELLRDWDIEVEHATITILKALKKKHILFKGLDEDREIVTYHDPCHIGRSGGIEAIYEEPREVIKNLGGKIIEAPHNRADAYCCGAGGGMRANFPKVAIASAKKKAMFTPNQVQKIISPCGLCYANFKSATDKSEEFSSFVLRRLNLKDVK